MTTNSAELKPCPMCGCGKNIAIVNERHDHSGGYYIACPECGTSTGLRYACGEDPRPLLIEAWNRRAAAQGEQSKATDFHGDGLGLAVFLVIRPGMIPRIGRPSKDIIASLREWFAANQDADIYVLRSWSDEVGCQSIENGRELLQMEGDELPPMKLTIADETERGHYYTADQMREYALAALNQQGGNNGM